MSYWDENVSDRVNWSSNCFASIFLFNRAQFHNLKLIETARAETSSVAPLKKSLARVHSAEKISFLIQFVRLDFNYVSRLKERKESDLKWIFTARWALLIGISICSRSTKREPLFLSFREVGKQTRNRVIMKHQNGSKLASFSFRFRDNFCF